MSIFPVQAHDLDGLVAFLRETLPAEPIDHQVIREKLWQESDPNLVLVWKNGTEVLGAGAAVARKKGRGGIVFLAVAKDAEQQQIGSQLLDDLEAFLRKHQCRLAVVGGTAPNYLNPGIHQSYMRGQDYFEAKGYERHQEVINVRADLSEVAPVTYPNLRRAQLSDREVMSTWLKQHWPSWWLELKRAFEQEPIPVFVVMEEQRPIAFAAHNCNNMGTGWFGPMACEPKYRGRGYGQQVLSACLADMKQMGHQWAIIPWLGPLAFYQKHCKITDVQRFFCFQKAL